MMKLLDPALIRRNTFLHHLIRTIYPVWVGPIAWRVLKKGRILD